MSSLPYLTESDLSAHLDWPSMVEALAAGHRLPPARIGDLFLTRDQDTLLNRAAWIDGIGMGLKTVTVIEGNGARGLPSVQGVMVVFDDQTGTPVALIDSALVTYWKTAADSGLGARYLARPDSRRMVIIGAGRVAGSLARVYHALFPDLYDIAIWNRTPASAQDLARDLAQEGLPAHAITDLEPAVAQADIVATATMARQPVLLGRWIQPGTHVDLVGAYRADMREADDTLLRRARIFVDSRATTLDHIGELAIPLAAGVITRNSVLGDFQELVAGSAGRRSAQDITLFKNGGGAHLDLMIAHAMIDAWRLATAA